MGFTLRSVVAPPLVPLDKLVPGFAEGREDPPPWVRVQGSGFRVQGSGFWVQGAGLRVLGLGFGV